MTSPLLRPAGFDDLGLRRALSDRLLPLAVGAMAFLAALALAGALAASGLARHWREGAGAMLTVQVPQPAAPARDGAGHRLDRVLAALRASGPVVEARVLGEAELLALLRPWLGDVGGRVALPLPAVIVVQLGGPADLAALAGQLGAAAPGTMLDADDRWAGRLALLARSLQASAAAALAVVGFVSVAVIVVVTRSGLAARREAIETVHGLGATDSYIAVRFARRATVLAAGGAAGGALAALPVLTVLARLAAPFALHGLGTGDLPTGLQADPGTLPLPAGVLAASSVLLGSLPGALWLCLPALPALAAAIGWLTAHATVRRWLRRLP